MDAKELGSFIAALRKENHMTQAELAKKIHVTDKAVSRWERGLGFPDINTIEPLADALGISVVELMCAHEKTQARAEDTITTEDVKEMLNSTADMTHYYRKKQNAVLAGIYLAVVIALGFVIDRLYWGYVLMLVASAVIGIVSLYSVKKNWNNEIYRYLYLRISWLSAGALFIGIFSISSEEFIKQHFPAYHTSSVLFMLAADVAIIWQAVSNAKKGKISWKLAVFTIAVILLLMIKFLYDTLKPTAYPG